MKTLGMIGGTSWHSTIDYYRYINSIVNERVDNMVSPPLLLYSLNIELMRSGDWNRISASYIEYAKMLENAGAKALIFCANTPHKVYPDVQPEIGIPILHIADATAGKAKELSIDSLGLLGTLPTMKDDFISGRIKDKFDIDVVLPDRDHQPGVHKLIADELTQGRFTEEAKSFVIEEMNLLKEKGAEGMILGCTELPMLVKPEDYDLPLMDTTYLHAQMAVDFILGK